MNKNSMGNILKKKVADGRWLKSVFYKSIFVICVLILVFSFTKINTNPTNKLIKTIKTNINYEFHVKNDSIRVYGKAKDMLNSTIESIPVFNTREKLDSPIMGTIFRGFDAKIETADGIRENGGVEIKLLDEKNPVSISDGRVTKVEKRDNKGYFISVEDEELKIVYGYLQSSPLKEGDIIFKGDSIGQVGINKDGSRYLRLELYIDDKAENPEKYINF